MQDVIRADELLIMKNITAVILAAGLGTRMKSETAKVLHKIGSKSILERTIFNVKSAGLRDIIVVVGHKAEEVEAAFRGEANFVRQKELLGSGDALKSASFLLKENVEDILVTCADAPLVTGETYKALLDRHIKERAFCTLLTAKVADPNAYGRIMRDKKGKIRAIIEEKDLSQKEKKINEINVGTYCFKRKGINGFISKIKINEKKKEFYLTDIIDIFVKNKKRIASVLCAEEEALGINSRKDLAISNKIVNRKSIERLMASGVTIVDPDTTFIDETARIAPDTIIFPNTIIEGNVIVAEGCKIGPFARLRPGTKLAGKVEIGNFVEICRTEIGAGTKVKHHTYLGDAVVGSDVNIGAGTITANYDGKNKNRTIIEDKAFIGVGVILIAPVRIGKLAKVGAGSVVTKNKDVPAGETVVGVPARLFGSKGK